MSSYYRETKNPLTGKWEKALWLDDCFGRHHYGVVFPSQEKVNPGLPIRDIAFDPWKVALETREQKDARR